MLAFGLFHYTIGGLLVLAYVYIINDLAFPTYCLIYESVKTYFSELLYAFSGDIDFNYLIYITFINGKRNSLRRKLITR